jgi:hypothetical protein
MASFVRGKQLTNNPSLTDKLDERRKAEVTEKIKLNLEKVMSGKAVATKRASQQNAASLEARPLN